MKKILLAIICLFTISTSFASIDSTLVSVSNRITTGVKSLDTSSVSNKIYDDITSSITALAKGLKVGAEHVYTVLVRQQVAYAITYLFFGILSLTFLLLFFKGTKNKEEIWSSGSGDYWAPTFVGVVRVLQGSIGFITLIYFIFCFSDMVSGFINPEYGAIKDIIDMVSKLKNGQ